MFLENIHFNYIVFLKQSVWELGKSHFKWSHCSHSNPQTRTPNAQNWSAFKKSTLQTSIFSALHHRNWRIMNNVRPPKSSNDRLPFSRAGLGKTTSQSLRRPWGIYCGISKPNSKNFKRNSKKARWFFLHRNPPQLLLQVVSGDYEPGDPQAKVDGFSSESLATWEHGAGWLAETATWSHRSGGVQLAEFSSFSC